MKHSGKLLFIIVAISTAVLLLRLPNKQTEYQNSNLSFSKTTETASAPLDLCVVSKLERSEELLNKFSNPTYECKNWVEFGGHHYRNDKVKKDGQKWVCLEPKTNVVPGNCVVYSFGISNEWSFDDKIAQFGCNVYAFDPTMGAQDHQRSPNIFFYNLGISDITGIIQINKKPCKVARLEDIRKKLGHQTTRVDYLKIDIEGSEIQMMDDIWKTSPEILTDYVGQIAMEIHIGDTRSDGMKKHSNYWELINRLDCLGFELAHYELNSVAKKNYTTASNTMYHCCHELVWVNKKLLL